MLPLKINANVIPFGQLGKWISVIFKLKIGKVGNLIVFGLLVVFLLAAQFATPKTVDEIIEKHIAALGGIDQLAKVDGIYLEGVKEVMGQSIAAKITKVQNKLSRTEIEIGASTHVLLVTDTAAYTFIQPLINEPIKVADEDLAALQIELDIVGPLVNYHIKGHQVFLLGKETVEDNTCYKIKLITKSGIEMLFWLDSSTYLLKQSVINNTSKDRKAGRNTNMLYRNYELVGGIKWAGLYEIINNALNEDLINGSISFHKIIVNPAVTVQNYQLT